MQCSVLKFYSVSVCINVAIFVFSACMIFFFIFIDVYFVIVLVFIFVKTFSMCTVLSAVWLYSICIVLGKKTSVFADLFIQ